MRLLRVSRNQLRLHVIVQSQQSFAQFRSFARINRCSQLEQDFLRPADFPRSAGDVSVPQVPPRISNRSRRSGVENPHQLDGAGAQDSVLFVCVNRHRPQQKSYRSYAGDFRFSASRRTSSLGICCTTSLVSRFTILITGRRVRRSSETVNSLLSPSLALAFTARTA